MKDYTVKSIDTFQTKEWFLKKHYAKRMPPISYCFGLFDINNILKGVISFGDCGGSSNSHNLIKGYKINELNRLCVNEGLEKNVLSFFVSKSLKLLPKPMAIISYADTTYGHHGYIYQATNWIYCGKTGTDVNLVKGSEVLHRKSFYDRFGSSSYSEFKKQGYEIVKSLEKHRYFIFLGNKKDIRNMKSKLTYKILPYPKGDNKRYNADYSPTVQQSLF